MIDDHQFVAACGPYPAVTCTESPAEVAVRCRGAGSARGTLTRAAALARRTGRRRPRSVFVTIRRVDGALGRASRARRVGAEAAALCN